MTLREHLDSIAEIMALQGATPQQILYFQLYLTCLGLQAFGRFGVRETLHEEPFVTLDRAIPGMWDLAREKYEGEGPGPLDQYLENDDLAFYSQDGEEFKRVFHELLNSAARSGKGDFDHLQPAELTDLVWRLCEYQEGMKIYNPYAGVASYSTLFSAGDNYYGEEYDKLTWGIGVLWMWMNDCGSANYVCGDSLSPKWKQKFDRIVSTPPIGLPEGDRQTFTEHLVEDAPNLLKKGGTAFIVTTMASIMGTKGRRLVETGMLDAVIVLPRNVFYWAPYPPVILKLRKGRAAGDKILLVDGSSFSSPGGSRTNIIDAGDIYRAATRKDPKFVAEHSIEEIAGSGYKLAPQFHLKGEEATADGIRMVPLSELGSFVRTEYAEGVVSKAVAPKDMVEDFRLMGDVKETALSTPKGKPGEKNLMYGVVERPALLISGSQRKLKFAYVSEPPVTVHNSVFVFEPDPKVIDKDYLAYALSKAEVVNVGSSVFVTTKEDLLMTRIPVPSLREQKDTVRKLGTSLLNAEIVIDSVSRRRLNVALVGSVDVPQNVLEDMTVTRKFGRIREADDWVRRNKGIDALIVRHVERDNGAEILMLCRSVDTVPVFILSDNPGQLEDIFGSYADEYLPGRCFDAAGGDTDLYSALFSLFDDRDTPAGRVRQVYSRQLEAAADLDGKFQFEGVALREELERILLSPDSGNDLRLTLRKIRDNCVLNELSRYGYIPPYDDRSFHWGAMVNLLADRYFKRDDGVFYYLEKEILPRNMAEMLRSCSLLMNQGGHVFAKTDTDTQWAAIHVVMAVLCHMAGMLRAGLFDKVDKEKTAARYWSRGDKLMFVSGAYTVVSREDMPSYLYAIHENGGSPVHLDTSECRKQGVKPGDSVNITTASSESRPYVTDEMKIAFYSKDFTKIMNSSCSGN